MIVLNGVSKIYPSFRNKKEINVLKDVSFCVKPGEFVSIVGPSGCGKTTLLNIIAGFISPSGGRVRFNGNQVKSPGRDRVMVFQEHNLFPWKTVFDNVEFGLKTKNMSKEKRKAAAGRFIRMVHLNGFEDSYPYQLSGGMRQRAALARALVVEPNCILMDEPMGLLDLRIRESLQMEILNLWQATGKTILMVTHDIEEALFISQRVLVMSGVPGTVKQEIEVDIPYPRRPRQKMEEGFYLLKKYLWQSVMRPEQ